MDLGVADLLPGSLMMGNADTKHYKRIRPLSLPGGALQPNSTGFLARFSGNDFLLQYKLAGGIGASFEGEICGMHSYRNKSWGASYGGDTNNGSTSVEYVFNADDPEEDWVIEVETTTSGSTPDAPVYLRVDQADHGDYSVVENLDSGSEKLLTVGTSDYTNPVTVEFLRSEARRFANLNADYREAVGTAATNPGESETTEGWFSWTEIAWLKAQADLSEDTAGYEGYSGSFNILVDLNERRNLPVLYDEGEAMASGLGLYTTGAREWTLLDPIGVKKWRDLHGIFDDNDDELQSIGWTAGEDNLISPLMNGGVSGMAKGCFLGIDGKTEWKITVTAGKYVGESWTPVQTEVVEVLPGELPEWGFDRETLIEGEATGWSFSKLEKRVGEGWETVAEGFDCYDHIRADFYAEGAKVFWAGRWRAGLRWGFPAFNDASPNDDSTYYKKRRLVIDQNCISAAT